MYCWYCIDKYCYTFLFWDELVHDFISLFCRKSLIVNDSRINYAFSGMSSDHFALSLSLKSCRM